MINKIKEFLTKLETKEEKEINPSQEELNLTCAALLIETAFADNSLDKEEILSIKKLLKEVYELDDLIIEKIVEEGELSVKNSTSLFEYTKPLNQFMSYENKVTLVGLMWKIAYADGNLDKYEEHLIRKISDLLHIDHHDFIQQKLEMR